MTRRPARPKAAVRPWQRARWEALPSRERRCLHLVFQLDQEHEQAEHTRWNRYEPRLPANAWRWLAYGPGTALALRLAGGGLCEAACRAAFATLAGSGLLLQRTVEREAGMAVEVRLTTLGRRIARAADEAAPA